ncbi:Trans-zeatin O-beta-D-glucosyltransferase [Bertholletia excelsa]
MEAQAVAVMVPFPAQSHLNQMLHLSCLLSAYDVPVHFACSAPHVRQAKLRFNDMNRLNAAKLSFHELPTPPFLSPAPDPNSPAKFPSHLLPSFEASLHLRGPMATFLQEISVTARRVIVIRDALMAYAVQDAATLANVESYSFYPTCAFTCYFDGWEFTGKSFETDEPEGLPSLEGCYTAEVIKFFTIQNDHEDWSSGILINSSRAIEGFYIDLLESSANKLQSTPRKIWAIGPLNREAAKESRDSGRQHKCLEWLDKQTSNSVVYVSFGTTTSLTDEQIKEIALGLEESRQKFIWSLRDADKADIFSGNLRRTQLPEGYEERVKEFGMVVRDWAPQLEILGHPSTGGFLSHCGWNSCLESITMGVPMAAWPMHSDQPKNAFLVTDILRAGVVVNKWKPNKELVSSLTIAEAVKDLMASRKGEEIRKKAEELGCATMQYWDEGGVSRIELDSFVAHIIR